MKRRNFIGLSAMAASFPSVLSAEPKSGTERAGDASGEQPLLRFGLITDVQYADIDPKGERHYRESIPKLKVAVDFLKTKDLPFTLHLGDFIDRNFSSFDPVSPLLKKLGHSVYHLLGNHDYSVSGDQKCRVVSMLGMPHDYYMIRHSGVRFLMMDTTELASYKYPEGLPQSKESKELMKEISKEKTTGGESLEGGVSIAQLGWLDRELTAADHVKEPVIICGHHPVLPSEGRKAWNNEAVIALIDQHPSVRAYFCGHNHAGAQVIRNGIPYITFKSILHEPDVNAYSVIHLYNDRVQIEGYGREKPRTIPLKAFPV
jgi:manganese-dependent ADP-ribose/CDP-alcohol diphosphatase